VVVTGASGFLGHRLLPLASRRAKLVAVSRSRPAAGVWAETSEDAQWHALDILDADAVARVFAAVRPAAVVNAAAATPGSTATTGDGAGLLANTLGAANVARAAAQTGARLVHVSTDIVHGGDAAPYADDAAATPINEYGATKAEGEQLVLLHCPGAVIVRTSLIYSRERMDGATASFAERLGAGDAVVLWADAIRHPVHADTLVEGLVRLALDLVDERGTLNLAGSEAISRAEFSTRLLRHWGVDTSGVVLGRAAAGQPLDLTLRFDRARALGLALAATTEVLSGR
jgi:dTDP-4-dehydrorhamnose reductase